MNTVAILGKRSLIGAWELKSSYQKNFASAFGLVLGAVVLIFVIILIIKAILGAEVVNVPTLIIRDISELGAPPSVAIKPTQIKVSRDIVLPKFTLPEAAPDKEVVEDFLVVSQEDFANIPSPVDIGEGDSLVFQSPNTKEFFPDSDEFVAVEELPVNIKFVKPNYPEIAQKAGIEGSVWIRMLVDKNGDVKDAKILKESGANAGFEEAALVVAKQTKWKPAMQNKQPVAVWISLEYRFALK